ncbi:MAG: alpha/beta hydrolase family protein [Actinomycetota bacterium]
MRAQAKRRGGAIAAMAAALACALPAAAPGDARASTLVTWTTRSDFVDPANVQFNNPPPGAPARQPALRVNVLLPDGFTRQRRWPVLYLLHGHGDAYDYWANPERGDLLDVAAGFPGIVVMPEGGRGWYVNWWNSGRRAGPAWERYHLDELIPLVEKRLPIRRARRWHAIAGLSMGGEGALFYASQRPGYFGSAASFSGAISIQRPEWPSGFDTQGEKHLDVFGDPQAQRFYWTGHNPTALTDNLEHTRLYVTVGDGVPDPSRPNEIGNLFGQVAEVELAQHASDFATAARGSGADVTYVPRQGIHDWPYWRRHLADAIGWDFFGPVERRPRSWTFDTVAETGEMWGLRFRFFDPPATLAHFSMEGRRLELTTGGTVRLRTPSGCRFALPGAVSVATLPRGYSRRPKGRRARARAKRRCRNMGIIGVVP